MTAASPLAILEIGARAALLRGVRWRMVLVGSPQEIAEAMQHPSLSAVSGFTVVGAVPFEAGVDGFPEAAIRQMVHDEAADSLLVTATMPRALQTSCGELAVVLGCRLLSLVPGGRESALHPAVVWEGAFPYVELSSRLAAGTAERLKRAFDLGAASIGLLVALPVIVLAAAAVRLESRGHPLFGHVRIGRGGVRFRCWKLRTMYADAEQRLAQDPQLLARYRTNDFKLPDQEDPRITRVGRLLRKTSLDELPQLWNVLMGEMSLVGPRPVVAEELQHFRGDVLPLLSLRPGVTGAWAVSGRHHLAYPRRAAVELAYVRERSFVGDLRILLKTVAAVCDPGFGASQTARDAAARRP